MNLEKMKRLLSVLVSLVLVVGMMPEMSMTAMAAEPVEYINYTYNNNGITGRTVNACETYTTVSSGTTTWENGWYVVNSNVTISSRVTASGTVHLILCDGCTLNAVKGINVATGNSLTIYAQSEDPATMGVLNSRTSDDKSGTAGIGGNDGKAAGTIVFNGGKITAQGSTDRNGAGGGAAFGGIMISRR